MSLKIIEEDLNTFDANDVSIAIKHLHFENKSQLVNYIYSLITREGEMSGKVLSLYNKLPSTSPIDETLRELMILSRFVEIADHPNALLNSDIRKKYIKSPDPDISDLFTVRKYIKSGLAGFTVSFENTDKTYNFCAKFGLDIYRHDDPVWEYTVSRKLNRFHPFVPYTYFGTYTSTSDNFDVLIDRIHASTTMLYIQEEVNDPVSLYDFYDLKSPYRYTVQLQIMCVLACMQYVGFTHYDLHGDNILLRKAPENTYMEYTFYTGEKRYLYMPYIVTIVDFGRAHVNDMPHDLITHKYNELTRKQLGTNFGVFTTEFNQYTDIFKFLEISESYGGLIEFSHNNLIDILGDPNYNEANLLDRMYQINIDPAYSFDHFIESFMLKNSDILDRHMESSLPSDAAIVYKLNGQGKNEKVILSSITTVTANMTAPVRNSNNMLRSRYEIPEEPPALVFYKNKFNFYNIVKIGVDNGLFTDEEAMADRPAAIDKVRKLFEEKIKKYLEEKDYESVSFLTGEKVTEETIAKNEKSF